ncbi:hypothetical protein ATN01_02345 [Buchnera aphidicola (Diuraphis noxia)]|uniref:BolA family transcriptional regulator n=1 Tax=Buchnera aphidicola subsp. Diuraphis noxia TaxID=118101 RepID=A0A1B2H8U9_BUCDN|nr:BolA/IbaG family iron-sulfur metabolism protein [Buchnera aphidicola]ANZ22661.1 hypothetical protein ATN01_02345 [Buchnera aphidicola (Diuraphis noxia)]
MILKTINQYLTSKLTIHFIKIYDDSLFHNHSKKDITHLRMIIVSDDFIKKPMINRHRMIFSILLEIKKEKIYSITLHTYTIHEWKYKKNKNISISQCFKKK